MFTVISVLGWGVSLALKRVAQASDQTPEATWYGSKWKCTTQLASKVLSPFLRQPDLLGVVF